eukprot:353060-Rhodomonas_salina.2
MPRLLVPGVSRGRGRVSPARSWALGRSRRTQSISGPQTSTSQPRSVPFTSSSVPHSLVQYQTVAGSCRRGLVQHQTGRRTVQTRYHGFKLRGILRYSCSATELGSSTTRPQSVPQPQDSLNWYQRRRAAGAWCWGGGHVFVTCQ